MSSSLFTVSVAIINDIFIAPTTSGRYRGEIGDAHVNSIISPARPPDKAAIARRNGDAVDESAMPSSGAT